ncbi:MAG: hypothetical protein MUC92_12350 [Fimbriimonadaceae bacterium]|jgi:hypothetical protein|nr:hypothetical protein [Fimbriimonadaceae bacterium]
MLWKQRYDTTIQEGVFLESQILGKSLTGQPFTGCEVLLGGFRAEDFSDQEILAKLFERDFPKANWLARGLFGNPELAETLELMVPPSRQCDTWLFEPHSQVETFEPRRVFCWLLPAGVLMLGPATEDAWEYFERRIHEVRQP